MKQWESCWGFRRLALHLQSPFPVGKFMSSRLSFFGQLNWILWFPMVPKGEVSSRSDLRRAANTTSHPCRVMHLHDPEGVHDVVGWGEG